MTHEARKIQICSVGRGIQGLVRRPENFSPYGAAADRAARLLLDLLNYTEKVNKLGVWLAQYPHPTQIADIASEYTYPPSKPNGWRRVRICSVSFRVAQAARAS
jgi:hypothetical protein